MAAEDEVNFPDGTELLADRVAVYLWTPKGERSGFAPISPPVSVFTSAFRFRGASVEGDSPTQGSGAKQAALPLGWRGAAPEDQWTEPTIVVTAVWPGWIGGQLVVGKSQPISYRERTEVDRFIAQAEVEAHRYLESNPNESEQMTGFILRARGSSGEVDIAYSEPDWQRGFVWQEPDSGPRQWVKNPSREMWWAMQYGDAEKFSQLLATEAVGVHPHDLTEPVLEPVTFEVYRGMSLFADEDPLSSEKHGGGVGGSWTTSLDVAKAIAERGMAGFTSYNVPGDIYEVSYVPMTLGNKDWDAVKNMDRDGWTAVVLRAEVTITPGPGETDPAFYYPFGANYASEQEVDIPRGAEVRITGYQRATRQARGSDYFQWKWPSSWTSANVVRTSAERWGMRAEAGSSWRPYAATTFWDEYPVVVHTDGGPSGRKSYDIYADGQQVATRSTLREAKQYVEDILGPQVWQTKRLEKVTIDHYWWGLTDEFSSPTTVYVVPQPTGDVAALNNRAGV
jgi:hypothetical protein